MVIRARQRRGARQRSGRLILCLVLGLSVPLGAAAEDVATSFEFNATGPSATRPLLMTTTING